MSDQPDADFIALQTALAGEDDADTLIGGVPAAHS
jgi:hypothetical protein